MYSNYAIMQLVVEESILNGSSYLWTYKNLNDAQQAFEQLVSEEKLKMDDFSDCEIVTDDELEFELRCDCFATKIKIIGIEKNMSYPLNF